MSNLVNSAPVNCDIIRHYIGYCNGQMDIKRDLVSGKNDAYIIAWSDDGRAFVWDKATGELVNAVKSKRGHYLHTWLASSSSQADTTRPSKSVRPGMSKWSKKNRAPAGFEYIQPVMDALESELREKMNEPHEGKRQCEALWPVHQINWQRSRYVYDMFYKYQKISREVYDYCIRRKLVDANLIAKWKKPGYERLCSTSAINTKNYNYGTVSICRVPRQQLSEGQMVQEKHSGCRGCASGPGGYHNIFGNKYGQYLARIQIARESKKDTEKLVWATKEEEEDAEESGKEKKRQREESSASDSSGESHSDNEEAKESEAPCEKKHKADK
ncbi:unnamed protein product [Peronospora farinosa]|uniref:G10 protein n=1 Tax=Peronospora farinosa TaxID=134698 RepID=A0ABN8C653_9STRA|nr:unnamed protein product [Peronospora farinosa]